MIPGGPLDPAQDPDRYDPSRDAPPPGQPLDMSQDPDRYDAARDSSASAPAAPSAGPPPVPGLEPLDMSKDPDRYVPPGQGQTLTDLLGKAGAQEEERDNLLWLVGLLAVFGFLGLVAFAFSRMSPG